MTGYLRDGYATYAILLAVVAFKLLSPFSFAHLVEHRFVRDASADAVRVVGGHA